MSEDKQTKYRCFSAISRPIHSGVYLGMLLFGCIMAAESDAAVTVTNEVVVSSVIKGGAATVLPHIEAKGSAEGTASALTETVSTSVELTYTGTGSLTINSFGSGNDSQDFNNIVTHTVSFSLGANEEVDITLSGIYDLKSAVLSSEFSWSLAGPGVTDVWSLQTVSSSGSIAGDDETGNINETAFGVGSATGGVYTLTLVSRTFGDTTEKVSDLASVAFSGLNFSVTAVPEPGPAVLGGMGCLAFCLIRKRA